MDKPAIDLSKEQALLKKRFSAINNIVYIDSSRISLNEKLKSGGFDVLVFSGQLDNSISVSVKVFALVKALNLLYDVFKSEITTALSYSHPRAPKLYGLSFETCNVNLVYDLIKGESLAKKLPKLSDLEKFDIVIQILEIFRDLHRDKIFHKGLRLGKFIVGSDDKVYIKDLTDSDYIRGSSSNQNEIEEKSIAYLPPEIVELDDLDEEDLEMNASFDVWSLCCIISQIFTGVKPWSNLETTDTKLRNPHNQNIKEIQCLTRKIQFPIPTELKQEIADAIKDGFSIDWKLRPTVAALLERMTKLR